jgi:hypothetical protein
MLSVLYILKIKQIKECIDEEEDEEFLVELSKTLPALLDNIGGASAGACKMIKLFESIITQDDSNVRREVKLIANNQ